MNKNITLNINAPIEVNKWCIARFNRIGYYNRQKFIVKDDLYNRKIVGLDATTNQTFTIKNITDIELTAGYYLQISMEPLR